MTSEGLPADRISLENGSIITNCKRWPLIIDPQQQVTRLYVLFPALQCHVAGRDIAAQGENTTFLPKCCCDCGWHGNTQTLFVHALGVSPLLTLGFGTKCFSSRSQGIKWLRKREEDNGLSVIQLSQKKWLYNVEQAIVNGNTLIIENIGEEIDSTLDPVLARAIYKKGR